MNNAARFKSIERPLGIPRLTVMACITTTAVGCHKTPTPPSPALVNVTAIDSKGTKSALQGQMQPKQFEGDWYVGDGTGYNLKLTLQLTGEFICKWNGCLGEYGSANGTWTLAADGVQLAVARSEGILEQSPEQLPATLPVLYFEKKYLLLNTADAEFYEKHGPSAYVCFHRFDELSWDD